MSELTVSSTINFGDKQMTKEEFEHLFKVQS